MGLVQVPGKVRAHPFGILHRHALSLHQANLGQIANVDDADRDVGRAGAGRILEAGAGRAGVLADAQQEVVVVANQAEHVHVAGQTVHRRGNRQVLAVGEAEGIERVHVLRGDGIDHVAVHIEGAAGHCLVGLAEVQSGQHDWVAAVGDVPGLEGILGVGGARAVGPIPSLAREDAVERAGQVGRVEDIGHLELVTDRAGGLEASVTADEPRGIAHVDD